MQFNRDNQVDVRRCLGKISNFKANGFRIENASVRTEAAAVKVGENLHAGHYWALTRNPDGGWLKKNDLACSSEKRFVSNLNGVYYALLTKT